MNNVSEINATCAKIAVLLYKSKENGLDRNQLLYCLAISDFVKDDGTMSSKNIRNINSLLYYSSIVNQAISKMSLYKLAIQEGSRLKASFSCLQFVHYCINQSELNIFVKKIFKAYDTSITGEFIKIYNELYKKYLSEKINIGVE